MVFSATQEYLGDGLITKGAVIFKGRQFGWALLSEETEEADSKRIINSDQRRCYEKAVSATGLDEGGRIALAYWAVEAILDFDESAEWVQVWQGAAVFPSAEAVTAEV
jgi:hypothetical protein